MNRLAILLVVASTACAAPIYIDFTSGGPTTKNTWIAGTDALNTWYSPHSTNGASPPAFSISGDVATLDHSNANHYRSLLYAVPMLTAGHHEIYVSTAYSDYTSQLNYWQAFAATDGTVFNLRSQTWSTVPTGSTRLGRQYAPDDGSEDGVTFIDYLLAFDVTAADVAANDYFVFALTGSRSNAQTLAFRFLSPDEAAAAFPGSLAASAVSTPEPGTWIAFASLLFLGLWRIRRLRY